MAAHWDRYLRCSPLPDPSKASEINDYFNEMNQESWGDLSKVMEAIEVGCPFLHDEQVLSAVLDN